MKICVVTVYDSINSGSFWQAFSLQIILEKMGNDVFFLKRSKKEKIKLKMFHLSKTVGLFLLKGPKDGINKVKINHEFKKSQKVFKIINYKKINKMDLVIIGSDTLWNLEDNYFKRNCKLFFGGQIKNIKQITYAISAANTKKDDLNKIDKIAEYINNFSAISVRDEKTKKLVKDIYRYPIYNVCDPTFLLEKEDYEKMVINPDIRCKYIFLYLFEKLTSEQETEIKEFAIKNKLVIVDGIGNKGKYDYVSTNTPIKFLSNIFYADYVITDTFHGTIFSVNLKKKFVVINRNKNKVNEFINKVGLNERLISNNICEILQKDVNYNQKTIKELKNDGVDYLNNSLNM